MSKYILKKMTADGSLCEITLARKRIATVRLLRDGPNRGQWIAVASSGPATRTIQPTLRDAYEVFVRTLNRIELCGEDDAAKAAAALDARNRATALHNAQVRADLAPVREAMEHVLGRSLPYRRPKSTKILI